FAPYLSNNLPVSGDIAPITIAPGSSIRPDFNGEKFKTFCINSGNKVSAPIRDINTVIVIIIANVNVRNLKIRNYSIDVFKTSCLQINSLITTIPATIVPRTKGLVHSFSEAMLKPYRNDPKPNDERMMDKISIFGLRSSVTFFKKSAAIVMVITEIGSMTMNNKCHEK